MKQAFYFFNPEITIQSIQSQTGISIFPFNSSDFMLILGTAEAVAHFRTNGDLHYVLFSCCKSAAAIFEELETNFQLIFMDEPALLTFTNSGKENFDEYIKATRLKYFPE